MTVNINKPLPVRGLRGNERVFKARRLALLLCLVLVVPLIIQIKPTSGAIIEVPAQYSKIKDAVNAAVTGDTIQVAPGTYYENNILIDVAITALSIIGADPETTIIDGMGNGTIFGIDGTNVYITGFTLRNAGNANSAIVSEKPGPSASTDYHRIINNIITTSVYGVSLGLSNRNTIFNNTFLGNALGAISLTTSATNNISRNIITDSAYGVRIYNSATNTLAANTITLTSYGIYILGATSTGNIIKNNMIAGRTAGIYSSSDTTTIDHNTIIGGSAAIYLQGKTATIDYNIIQNSSCGIRFYYASATTTSHNVRNNKITDSDWAIEATYSYGNTFKANWIQHNTYGIYMSFCYSNTFYENNFIQNTIQTAAGTGTNTWSSGGLGNYWSDYNGVDANGNGIGDTPYLISPIGQDNYPLMRTWSEHDIAVLSVTPSTNEPAPGTTVTVTVTVRNNANTSVSETFTVTARYNNTIIGTQQATALAQSATLNLIFNWNTTGIAPGNYTISAEASIVPNELNTNNNKLTDGVVWITKPVVGDINGDGEIDDQDLALLVQAYGAIPGSPNWNPNADLNEDTIIDACDLRLLGQNYSATG